MKKSDILVAIIMGSKSDWPTMKNTALMLDKLKIKSKKVILIYCGSGNSSAKAMRLLSQKGFESVMSIEGGFSEWVKLQLPVSHKNI